MLWWQAMGVARATAVLAAVGLLASPLAALFCTPADAAAMACCRTDMSSCNKPGKTEDCCRKAPASEGTSTAALKAQRPDKLKLAGPPSDALAVAALAGVPAAAASPFAFSAPLLVTAAPSPPRSPILRI